jgi:acyl-CoA synthetase (NDP forming)
MPLIEELLTTKRRSPNPERVRALLCPANIAIVGASEREGSWSRGVWESLRRFGYEGPVYPVNPRYDTIWGGMACYRDLVSLPTAPDHVVVLVPGEAAVSMVEEAAGAGARSATIFASGFGEGGSTEGSELGRRLAEIVARTGIALSGPNCLGNMSAPNKLLTIPDDRILAPETGPVAIFGQSGGIVMAVNRSLASRGIAVSYAVTSGNELGANAADYIQFFAEDPGIRVIACFIEALHEPESFIAACRAAHQAGKPVVLLKIGGSEASRAAALAHTGSLAGSLDCFDAVTRNNGVVRVDTLDDMVEVTHFFARASAPKGTRVGAITFSGGLKGLMMEAAERTGVTFPDLTPATLSELETILGVGTSLGNPLDAGFTALSSRNAYMKCIEIMRADPNVDLLLLQEELPGVAGTNRKIENMRMVNQMVAEQAEKPIAVAAFISYMMTDYSRALARDINHLPFLHEINKALRAVGAAGRYGQSLDLRPEVEPLAPKPSESDVILAAARPLGGWRILDEAQGKQLLRAYGIPSPVENVAETEEGAISAAEKIGYPVVLKLLSHRILHKSDRGGVLLNVGNSVDVREGFRRLSNILSSEGEAPRVLVAAQARGFVEVAMGIQHDPEVGPVVMFGGGGTLVELYRDVGFGPAGLSRAEAVALIEKTRVSKLLTGYRGGPPHDVEAVIAALVGLGRLARDHGAIIESLDLNPFAVLPAGQGGFALDALIVLRP